MENHARLSGFFVSIGYRWAAIRVMEMAPILFQGRGGTTEGGCMGLRMRVHDKEPIGQALRRFKKLIERSGMQKELRAHQYYEKPCEQRRRSQLRKVKAVRKAQIQPVA
jgi:small subunit ribosomal protein S21